MVENDQFYQKSKFNCVLKMIHGIDFYNVINMNKSKDRTYWSGIIIISFNFIMQIHIYFILFLFSIQNVYLQSESVQRENVITITRC